MNTNVCDLHSVNLLWMKFLSALMIRRKIRLWLELI